VEQATTWAGLPVHSGLGWWVNRNPDGTRFWPCLPPDAFYGAGAGHQFLLVVPSLDLIVVRNGESLEYGVGFNEALGKHLVVPLMACFEKQ
jgi:CubicO group peptidase (beta-lactamase class C family)